MILQALARYYQRLLTAGRVPPFGFQNDTMPFIIVIDRDGTFKNLLDTREGTGKDKRAKECVLPRRVKRTSGIAANLLWDNKEYVLGHDDDNPTTAGEKLDVFVKRIKDVFGDKPADEGVAAVLRFYERKEREKVFTHPNWKLVEEKGGNLSFKLDGETGLVCEREAVQTIIAGLTVEGNKMQCLISGGKDIAAELHNAIRGVRGAQLTGANIVSFNLSAFESYGKEQGYNAPVGMKAEFAYVTALNELLKRDSHQKIQVGDATTVFWTEKEAPIEDWLVDVFEHPEPEKVERLRPYVDSVQDTIVVRTLFGAAAAGQPPPPEDQLTGFYVLGLSPNAARLSVRFWYEGTVGEVARRVALHFADCRICHRKGEMDDLAIYRLLASTAFGKSDEERKDDLAIYRLSASTAFRKSDKERLEKVPPNLAGDMMRSILAGTAYPETLLGAAIRRNKTEREVTYPRAALIKAILTRKSRLEKNGTEVGMALDRENQNIGYLLGRLFAVMEQSQKAANPGINATIRDRYYGAMSSRPATVLPLLTKLNKHHLAKLGGEKKGWAVNLEKEIGEIIEKLSADGVPPFLTLEDQGRFAIGYYHQRQDFFKGKEETNEKEKE